MSDTIFILTNFSEIIATDKYRASFLFILQNFFAKTNHD